MSELVLDAPRADAPAAPVMARAVFGFLVAGASAGLGAAEPEVALRAVPAGLVVAVGALLLTVPALVVGHQYLGLEARPVALVGALGRAFVRAGAVASGLSPVLAFFSLSTGLWVPMSAVVGLLIAAVGFAWAGAGLRSVEAPSVRLNTLVLAWSTLAGLVALRLAFGVATLVLE